MSGELTCGCTHGIVAHTIMAGCAVAGCPCTKFVPVHEIDRRTISQREEAAILEGFADCEALIIAMARSQAEALKDDAVPSVFPAKERACFAFALEGFALAVSLGQHRTDQYDEAKIRAVHAKAGMPAGMQSKGGKARAASMTAKQRSALGRKAVKARWARKEGE